jgi:hypothetical protein
VSFEITRQGCGSVVSGQGLRQTFEECRRHLQSITFVQARLVTPKTLVALPKLLLSPLLPLNAYATTRGGAAISGQQAPR